MKRLLEDKAAQPFIAVHMVGRRVSRGCVTYESAIFELQTFVSMDDIHVEAVYQDEGRI